MSELTECNVAEHKHAAMNAQLKAEILEALRTGEVCTISHFMQLYHCDSNKIKQFHQIQIIESAIAKVEAIPVTESES